MSIIDEQEDGVFGNRRCDNSRKKDRSWIILLVFSLMSIAASITLLFFYHG